MLKRALFLSMLFAAMQVGAAIEPKKYEVQKLAEGVYALVWADALQNPIESNSLFIINEQDVIVVESSILPSTARIIISEIRKLTPKPVRLLINSHWHDDHIMSNSVFREAWPGIEFVAHRNTRTDANDLAFGALPRVKAQYKTTLEQLRAGLVSGIAPDGKVLDDARRKRWVDEVIPLYELFLQEAEEVRTALPDLVFDDHLIIHRGNRTIEVRYLGRGNTRGDVVVWLPQEKVLATGDLVVYPIPFGIGSYYADWVKTLDRVLDFPAETIFLSHGPIQKNKDYVRTVRGLIEALVTRVAAEAKKGSSLEETKANVTLADWKTKMAGDDQTRQYSFDAFFVTPAVARAYLQAKGDPAGQSPKGLE